MNTMQTANYGWGSTTPHTAAYLSGDIIKVLEQSGAKIILDAGCGNGALAGLLKRTGFIVTGVDADEGGIAIARSHFPDIHFDVGTFDGSPPGTFDAVCSTEVIEHLYAPHFLARYSFEAL